MKKHLVSIILLAASAAIPNHGFAAEVSASSTLRSKYVVGNGANFYDGPVVQTDLSASWKSGVYLDVYNTTGVARRDLGPYGNETDYAVGYARSAGGLDLDANVSYWDCSHQFSTNPSDVVVFTVSASKALTESTSVALKYEHYQPTNQSFYDSGMRAGITLSHSRKVVAADLDTSVTLVRDDGAFGLDPSFVASATTSLSWNVGDVKLKAVELSVYKPLRRPQDGRRNIEAVVGAGLSYAF